MYLFAITKKTMNVRRRTTRLGSTVNLWATFHRAVMAYISSGLKYIADEIKEQQPSHLVLVPCSLRRFTECGRLPKSGRAQILRAMIKVSNFLRKLGIDLRSKLFKSVLDAFGGKLELIICGGAYLDQEIIDTFDSLGITVLNGYGITECSPLISCNRNKYRKKGSVGVPILGSEVKIKDPDENGEGEICVKGPHVMLGYYRNPEATKEVFDDDGFFKTGDYGRLDDDGWLYITGRLKNLIVLSNGKNVYPEEIEAEIAKVFGVNECVVYASESRSQKGKEVIVAEIFPDSDALKDKGIRDVPGYFEEEIKKINSRMVSYKAVKKVKIREEEFPKNTSRKIIRFAIDKTIE